MAYPETLPLVRQVSWADQPASRDTRDITQLAINESTARFIFKTGALVKAAPGDGIQKLGTQGIAKCAAVLLRSAQDDGEAWHLAHARQLDEALYTTISDCPDRFDEALFVVGSVSKHQIDIREALENRRVPMRFLHAETGGAHFGVVFDIPSEELTVVRKTPDQSLLTYRPFA